MNDIETWNIAKSKALYGIENWGAGYFDVNSSGHVTVAPDGINGPKVDLYELINSVIERDISPPVLLRFNGILRHRVRTLYAAFQNAIKEHNYNGSYMPAFPIKVNQQKPVVDVLRQAGKEFSMGLEVGSKPELIAVLAIHDNPDALLICNGYKDSEYIELALISKKVGRQPILVIEKLSELATIIEVSQRLNIAPDIGFRLKLSGKGAGRWERSGGERAKFGLSIGEILSAINTLRSESLLDSVKMLHFHAGSQLTSIDSLKKALKEAGQVYVQLRQHCENLSFIDVGGGLGVDYDGSKTSFESSMNYTMEEYARDVVWILDDICDNGKVPHPNIVTECGRALAAYHSVLVFNVLGKANTFFHECNPEEVLKTSEESSVRNLAQLLLDLSPKNCQETLHDAMQLRNDMLSQFNLGFMSIEDRAWGDACYWALLRSISEKAQKLFYLPEDLERLPSLLTDTYFCNLSVFQSLPDVWAIHQIFPITPINRLKEEPNRPVVIADITCDSDGKIDRFADLRDVKRYLPAHDLRPGEPYYFAAFLVGAYQEILGDMHNLLGDTNAVHIEVDEDGTIKFTNVVYGDSVGEVLRFVQYDRSKLIEHWRNALERAVIKGSITPVESAEIFKKYVQAFDGYTYLE
ncbi:MAG: biosynthetic arginine decarboxylase [Deltaproteobacteria bacterium]|nr:biosynthetic arginine decarboxylase [Deltaproteobacteria bacterium]